MNWSFVERAYLFS